MYIWNPYGLWPKFLAGLPHVRLNMLDDIYRFSKNIESDCRKLVSTFWSEPVSGAESHWRESSRALFASIVQFLIKFGNEKSRNLPTARRLLTAEEGETIFDFARHVMTLDDPYLRESFSRYAAPGAEESKELAGIISSAITETEFLSDKATSDALSAADVSLRDLKRKPGMTLSVVLPINRLDDNKCFSLISGWMLHCTLEEAQNGSNVPCVAVIDEMSQIGPSKAWQDAFGLAAGMGMQIVAVYQDVSQIMNQFGKAWQTIVQNCGVTMWFASRDQSTREMVSKMAGIGEVIGQARTVDGWVTSAATIRNRSDLSFTRMRLAILLRRMRCSCFAKVSLVS
jgi:type IV secretory pathway TraG/TraD family ATPase VirD4